MTTDETIAEQKSVIRQLEHRAATATKERDVCRDETRSMADQLAASEARVVEVEAQLALARSALQDAEARAERARDLLCEAAESSVGLDHGDMWRIIRAAHAAIAEVPDRMAALQAERDEALALADKHCKRDVQSVSAYVEARRERDALAEKLAAAEARVRELEAEQAHDNVFTGAEDEVQALRETAEVVTESLWAYDRMRERAEKAEARVRELVQRAHTMLTDKGVHPGIVGERDSAERLWERIEDHVQPARRIEFEGLRERAEKAEARAERLATALGDIRTGLYRYTDAWAVTLQDRIDAALRDDEPHTLAKCADPEMCDECNLRDCPWQDPLHYHHDGCPSCTMQEASAPEPAPSQRAEEPGPNEDSNAGGGEHTRYAQDAGDPKVPAPAPAAEAPVRGPYVPNTLPRMVEPAPSQPRDEPPSEPGWYWARYGGYARWAPVRLSRSERGELYAESGVRLSYYTWGDRVPAPDEHGYAPSAPAGEPQLPSGWRRDHDGVLTNGRVAVRVTGGGCVRTYQDASLVSNVPAAVLRALLGSQPAGVDVAGAIAVLRKLDSCVYTKSEGWIRTRLQEALRRLGGEAPE